MAVIWQMEPGTEGAVNKPVASTVPQEADHVAGILAVNCCVRFCAVVAEAGVMTKGDVTDTTADAVLPVPSVAVAVTVQSPVINGVV
jgi:hypothetical protein